MTSFKERDPRPIAVIGLVVLTLATLLGLNAARLPFLHPTHSYTLELADSVGLQPGNDVTIAGIRVGHVTGVKVAGDKVVVTIDVDEGQDLGDATTASVELATLLGTKYVALVPAGDAPLRGTIPLARTSVPFELPQLLSQLGSSAGSFDQEAIQQALATLTETMRAVQPSLQPLLDGLAQLSTTVAGKDEQLGTLLTASKTVTASLAEEDDRLVAIMGDADLVLQTVHQRRRSIEALLRDVRALATQISGLVREDRAALDPILTDLRTVAGVLSDNLPALERTADLLAPFSRYATNATGNGRWADLYVNNPLTPDNVQCAAGQVSGCK
jgi:phospholipid/cholesterol/gamma-HCH transport system substrate-binding protein